MAIKWPKGMKVLTANDPTVEFCTEGGVEHDLREYTYAQYGKWHTSLVCVWCHGVACGNPDQPDPCVEIYHHTTPHRTRGGVTWAVGSMRPEALAHEATPLY